MNNNECLYTANRIKEIMNEMDQNRFYSDKNQTRMDFASESEDLSDFAMALSELDSEFEDYAKKCYILVLAFLEMKELPLFVKEAMSLIKPILEDKRATEEEFDPSWGYRNLFLNEVRNFLSPFREFQESNDKFILQNIGLRYLENILVNTAVIINKRKLSIKKETDVYNAVKDVIGAVYPNVITVTNAFARISRTYRPDLYVPALQCAVEYKYARNENEFMNTLDGVLADVSNYADHEKYKLFYAVFYVTDDFLGELRFKEIWHDRKFPENWKGFYIVGK